MGPLLSESPFTSCPRGPHSTRESSFREWRRRLDGFGGAWFIHMVQLPFNEQCEQMLDFLPFGVAFAAFGAYYNTLQADFVYDDT